jgi:hypothetical protein
MWRAWNHLEFVFGWTDEQWALLSSRPAKEITAPQIETATPASPVALPAPAPEPNIVYHPIDWIEAHREHGGTIREGRGPRSSLSPYREEWFPVCLANFRNEVLKKVSAKAP